MRFCAHCRRDFEDEKFSVRRRERRRFVTGERVLSAIHERARGGCGMETEYPEIVRTAQPAPRGV